MLSMPAKSAVSGSPQRRWRVSALVHAATSMVCIHKPEAISRASALRHSFASCSVDQADASNRIADPGDDGIVRIERDGGGEPDNARAEQGIGADDTHDVIERGALVVADTLDADGEIEERRKGELAGCQIAFDGVRKRFECVFERVFVLDFEKRGHAASDVPFRRLVFRRASCEPFNHV